MISKTFPQALPSSYLLSLRYIFAVLLLSLATLSWGQQDAVFNVDGLAIRGYDPVAYFTDGEPVAGEADFQWQWQGATWRFVNAANLATFQSDPERYAPQYGGYCAYAVANNYTATTDPGAWHIHDDKLYLNYNRGVRFLWRRDIPGNVASADTNWPAVLGK